MSKHNRFTPRDAERYLLSLELFGMRFGLDRMRRLMTALDSPHERFESIHVVGTNGKSSTARMTAAILRRHGLQTGAYLSPHLTSFAERIEIAEVAVSREPLLVARGPDRRARLHAPLVHRGELVGIVSVAAPVGRTFGEYDLRTLTLFAEHGASAVAHARLYAAERAHVEELAELAFYDPLTHLANRALFIDRVQHALHRARRHRSPAAVLFLDLDNFKTVNDSLGHVAGDRLLVAVAERLRSSVRTTDTPARLGGDEFAVLLEDVDEEKHAMIAAERVIDGLREPFTLGGHEVFVTASVGVAVSGEGCQVDELLRNADAAMYSAKRQGKARSELFRPAMHAAALELLEVQADLQRALDRNELFLEYQPTVELLTGRVVGLEALVRWQHPERGVLLPKQFIPLRHEFFFRDELADTKPREVL